jgi:hypothetical protein
MVYTYVLDTLGNPNIESSDLDSDLLYILCYHINNQCKYPFLQFMLEKTPFCNNLMEEQFVLPNVYVEHKLNIKEIVLEKVKNSLHSIGLNSSNLNKNMYKGILFSEQFNSTYAVVNISDLDICSLSLSKSSNHWFILPTEIINSKTSCGITVDNFIVQLFTHNPQLAVLTNQITNKPYILPDAVYTEGTLKNVEFNSVFGNTKTKVYKSCGSYYYFYKSFLDAVKQKHVGITRYALFVEGELYYESEKEFSLTDTQIEHLYPDLEQTIVICYSNSKSNSNYDLEEKPDLLVRKDNIFVPLSFHL